MCSTFECQAPCWVEIKLNKTHIQPSHVSVSFGYITNTPKIWWLKMKTVYLVDSGSTIWVGFIWPVLLALAESTQGLWSAVGSVKAGWPGEPKLGWLFSCSIPSASGSVVWTYIASRKIPREWGEGCQVSRIRCGTDINSHSIGQIRINQVTSPGQILGKEGIPPDGHGQETWQQAGEWWWRILQSLSHCQRQEIVIVQLRHCFLLFVSFPSSK